MDNKIHSAASGNEARKLPLTISWFDTAYPKGPALGDPESMSWGAFTEVFKHRREGSKDGTGFVPARFKLEADGRHVRRLKANLIARTTVALDIETNKATGEIPPSPSEAMNRAKALGLACVVYTSHNHHPTSDIRFRIVFPLSAEIAIDIPAPEIMAERLDLDGVLDRSKIGAASFFYLPSCPHDALDGHQSDIADGAAIDATWITQAGGAILAAQNAEKERVAAVAQADAATRREAKIAAGFDPDAELIDKIRSHLDLESILLAHGYDKSGSNYRHPNSTSGCHGANIKTLGGIERIFSHNASDPMYASNLPEWCGGVSAVDAFDATAILDFGGDRKKALRSLAERFNLDKKAERKVLASMLFRLIREQATQEAIEAQAFAEGARLGLSSDDICKVAAWVAGQSTAPRKAA